MNHTHVLASLLVVSLGSAVPARGLAQPLTFDPIPSAPLTAAVPLPVAPLIAAAPGQRDRDGITRNIEEALQRVREQLPDLDAQAIQKKLNQAMKDIDWDTLNKKVGDASKAFEAQAPQIARLMQDADKLQQQRKTELLNLQKKLQDSEVLKEVLKTRELGQRPFEAFARNGGPRGYSAVLVIGDMQGGASVAENVPEAAKKALADMKDFLPYKNYRLLDSAWVAGRGGSVSRLRGAEDQVYQLSLNPSAYVFSSKQVSAGRLRVTLVDLDETQARSAAQSDVDASMRRFAESQAKLVELRARLEAERGRYGSNHPDVKATEAAITKAGADVAAARVAVDTSAQTPGQQQSGSSRPPIVDTSFDITVGETVVVGTSRLRGDKALILLLTAVPQSSTDTAAPKGTTNPK